MLKGVKGGGKGERSSPSLKLKFFFANYQKT